MGVRFLGFSEDGVYFELSGQQARELAVICGALKGWEPIPSMPVTIEVTIHPQGLDTDFLHAKYHSDPDDRPDDPAADLFTAELPQP